MGVVEAYEHKYGQHSQFYQITDQSFTKAKTVYLITYLDRQFVNRELTGTSPL